MGAQVRSKINTRNTAVLSLARSDYYLPVGKSGAGMCFINSLIEILGFFMRAFKPAATSPMLWGGILVAIPTAIPVVPLMSRLGNLAGNTRGSLCKVESNREGGRSS